MKILAIADKESAYLRAAYEKNNADETDIIISCGDLDPRYLSFLAEYAHAPVIYVHGNHDGGYDTTPPEGCICIEDDIYVYEGVRIMGLGGSLRYNNGPHQYTEREMRKRARRMRRKLRRHKGFDILVTHAPVLDFNDGDDLPHTGFKVFHKLLEKYRPGYFIHGHIHITNQQDRTSEYNGHTTVVNAYERYSFEYSTDGRRAL